MVVFITTRDNNNIITTKGTVATRPTLTISKTLVNIYDWYNNDDMVLIVLGYGRHGLQRWCHINNKTVIIH